MSAYASPAIHIDIPSSAVYTSKSWFYDENGNPAYIIEPKTYPVTVIYDFRDCVKLQSVSIPCSIRDISVAFSGCTSLQSIAIPNSVTNLCSHAFSGCTSLESVILSESIPAIGSTTFSGCSSLKNIAIPNSVQSIGKNAFYGCGSLKEVEIPASVTDIAFDAFMSCGGLQRFIVDPANPVYASYDGALYTKDLKTLICYPGGRTDVKLPSGAVETKEDAFTGCGKLWAEWYRTFQKTSYDLTGSMEDRAIASVTVSADTTLDAFVLKDGKVYDTVLYISNTVNHTVRLTLPQGNIYKTFKGAKPLEIPAGSQSILTVTRIAGGSTTENVFLVSREELETVE